MLVKNTYPVDHAEINTHHSPWLPWQVVGADYFRLHNKNKSLFSIKNEYKTIAQLLINKLGAPKQMCVISNAIVGSTNWEAISLQNQIHALRTGAGVFEASGMMYLHVKGHDAKDFLNYLTPREVDKLNINEAMYIVFTNEWGTIDDEGVLLRIGPDEYIVSCGGCKQLTYAVLALNQFPNLEINISDIISFNIKGAQSRVAMLQLIAEEDRSLVASLKDFKLTKVKTLSKHSVFVLKTKIGMEMWGNLEGIHAAWTQMLNSPQVYTPCGWDMLHLYRMECQLIQFLLYPLELNHNTYLWEIGQTWMTKEKHAPYIGKSTIDRHAKKPRFLLKKIRLESKEKLAFMGDAIYSPEQESIGVITSSAFSYQHQCMLAYAHIEVDAIEANYFLIYHEASHQFVKAKLFN